MSPPPFQPQPQQVQQPAYQQQPSLYQQPQQPNSYQQPNAYQQPQQPNAYQQQPPQQAVNQAPAWAAPQQQQQQQEASAEQMFSPPIPTPYPVSQSTSIAASTGNVSTASAEELFASPSPVAKQEKVPDLPTAEPVTRTVTEDNIRELFATSAGESVPEQQPKADVAAATSEVVAAANEPTAASAAEALAAPTVAKIPPNSAGATGGAADFFGSAPHGVESKPLAAAASSEDKPEKVKEMQRVLSSTDDMDEVGLDDVPLEEVPLTPALEGNANGAAPLNNPSAATGAGVFSSIGLPPPPFSSRQ
jgi:hypothetical protein